MSRARVFASVIALVLGGTVLAGGCSGSGDDRPVSAARFAAIGDDTLGTASAVPAPTGATVLVISGAVGRPNVGARAEFDLATLERLGLREGVVFEPWEKRDIRFTGVDLKRVLDSVGVPATATSIHVTALDDYQVDLTMDEIRSGEIVLATRQDGAAIPLDKGGPTRIVFGPGVASGQNPDQWIWSLALIEVHA